MDSKEFQSIYSSLTSLRFKSRAFNSIFTYDGCIMMNKKLIIYVQFALLSWLEPVETQNAVSASQCSFDTADKH